MKAWCSYAFTFAPCAAEAEALKERQVARRNELLRSRGSTGELVLEVLVVMASKWLARKAVRMLL